MKLKIVFFLIVVSLVLPACSLIGSPNNITRVVPTEGATQKAHDGRYENLFPERAQYPLTCTEQCYQPHALVACESERESGHGEQCRFVGENKQPGLDTGFEVHWLGHATFLITTPDQQQFFIDPVSDGFDQPIDFAFRITGGHKRAQPEWLPEEQREKIDAVLYSHLHYDHFSKRDIRVLGNAPTYFVHLDTAPYLPKLGLSVYEMDWFTKVQMKETTVHAVPAHHFNSRVWIPFIYNDDEQALWGGWILEHNGKTLFYAGDTGYSDHFKKIHERYGDIDVCLIPIASYHHEKHGGWYRYVHTTPEDALVAAEELNCKVMIPWGYGNASWQMGDHSSHAPLIRLLNMHERLESQVPLYLLNEGDAVAL